MYIYTGDYKTGLGKTQVLGKTVDETSITAQVLHTIHWEWMQITIAFRLHFNHIAFILLKKEKNH